MLTKVLYELKQKKNWFKYRKDTLSFIASKSAYYDLKVIMV